MFKKVMAAEDLDTINFTLEQVLKDLEIPEIDQVKYCDDAMIRMMKAKQEGHPFELLITDLSFKKGHRVNESLKSGEALIEAAKRYQPDIKIIILSIEDRPYLIRNLFSDYEINGYVVKGRNSIVELKKAIQMISEGGDKFLSQEISHVLRDNSLQEIEPYDRQLLKEIAKGLTQKEIAVDFQSRGIIPGSESSIEKRINKLKICLKANNNVHLIAIAKDLGLV
ncbi:response regulator [Flavobacterium sp.]|uniref:response regulator n=1 Tax=Flavobacterium sp. TaxID=239 RepID=UPI002616AC8A|nr:response regulator [Flavobacterium sp.]